MTNLNSFLQQLSIEDYDCEQHLKAGVLHELSLKCGVIVQLAGERVHVSGVPSKDVKIVQEIAALCGWEVR